MGAASTIPLRESKEFVMDNVAQPKELPIATNKVQDRVSISLKSINIINLNELLVTYYYYICFLFWFRDIFGIIMYFENSFIQCRVSIC